MTVVRNPAPSTILERAAYALAQAGWHGTMVLWIDLETWSARLATPSERRRSGAYWPPRPTGLRDRRLGYRMLPAVMDTGTPDPEWLGKAIDRKEAGE